VLLNLSIAGEWPPLGDIVELFREAQRMARAA
jgi:hypothetical protein